MITNKQAGDIINYFFDAGVLNLGTADQAKVWADYINSQLPHFNPNDLMLAARKCIETWIAEGRAWKVDVGRYVATMKKIRSERLTRIGSAYRGPDGLTGTQEREWTKRFIAAVGDGLEVEQAITATDQALGVTRAEIEAGARDVGALLGRVGRNTPRA